MALKTRVNNASTLNLASAWSPATVPTTTDQLYWNGVTGTNATVAMGGNINVGGTGGGIRLDSSQTVAVTVNNATAAALTLGTLGIDLSTSGANLTIGGTAATLVLNANQTWQEKAGLSTLIYSAISGAFSINFASGGFWYLLSSGNSYSGGTTVGGAVVRISSNTAFGTGAITLNSGAQASSTSATGYTLANALTLNGTITLGDAVGTGLLTFSGTTTIAGTTTLTTASTVTLSGQLTGTGTLTKSGAGDLFLTGTTNNNSGAVTISQGNIWLASDNSGTPNQLASVSSITINSPGQIFYNGATSPATITSTISGGGTLVVSTTNGVTFSGNLSGYTQQLYLYSTNTTGTTTKFTASAAQAIPTAGVTFQSFLRNTGALTQTFEYTGAANVSSTGVLRLNPGANGHNYVVSNANTGGYTLFISGAVTALTSASPNLVLDVGASAGLLTLSGNITQSSTGLIAVSKTGSGPATLSGANTFTGTVSVSTGTLNANSATALGAASSTAAISVTSGATLSLGAALNYSSPGRTTTISGTGVGGTAGALVIAQTGDVNVGSISLAGPTTIRGTVTGGRLTSSITGTQNLTLNIDTSVTTTLAGAISTSTGSLTKSGSGTLSLTNGTNAYSGGTTISAGTLSFSSGALGSSGSVSVSSAALQWLNANTQDLSARLVMPSIGGYSEIDVGANNVSFASAIGNSGSAALYKSGTGALTLTQASTYTGLTTIAAGTLRAGTANALASSSQVAIGANTATLQTLTTGGQNGKLTVAALTNSAGGTIKIGG